MRRFCKEATHRAGMINFSFCDYCICLMQKLHSPSRVGSHDQVVDTSKQLQLGSTGTALWGGLARALKMVVATLMAMLKLISSILTSPTRIAGPPPSEPRASEHSKRSEHASSSQACILCSLFKLCTCYLSAVYNRAKTGCLLDMQRLHASLSH